jgi:hypothetical protein
LNQPIDVSGLKIKGIVTRAELIPYEAENVRKGTYKYFAKNPTKRTAPFDLSWSLKLHREMFWAGLEVGRQNTAEASKPRASASSN